MNASEERRSNFAFNAMLSILLLVGIAILANILIRNRFVARLDLTEDRENSIGAASRRVLSEIPGRVVVKAYVTQNVPAMVKPLRDKLVDTLKEYQAYSNGKLVIDWIDPEEGLARKQAEDDGIQIIPIKVDEGDEVVGKEIALGLRMNFRDREKTIPVVVPRDIPLLEYQLTMALKGLTSPKKSIGFLTREGAAMPNFPGMEQPQGGRLFDTIRKVLEERYNVTEVDVKSGTPIAEDVEVLVVARPKDMSDREKFEVDQFVMRGGRVIFLVDRNEYTFDNRFVHKPIETGLDDLFENYGFRVEKELIFDKSNLPVAIPEEVNFGGQRVQMQRDLPYPFWVLVKGGAGFSKDSSVTSQITSAAFLWAHPVTVLADKTAGLKTEEIIYSSEASWRTEQVDKTYPETSNLRKVASALTGKKPAKSAIAVTLSGKFHSLFAGKEIPKSPETPKSPDSPEKKDEKPSDDANRKVIAESPENRMIVFGDSDFVTDRAASFQPNLVLFQNAVDWLVLESDLAAIRSKTVKDRPIIDFKQEYEKEFGKTAPDRIEELFDPEAQKTMRDNKSNVDEKAKVAKFWIKWGNLLGMPAIVIAAGLWRFASRRKARLTHLQREEKA